MFSLGSRALVVILRSMAKQGSDTIRGFAAQVAKWRLQKAQVAKADWFVDAA